MTAILLLITTLSAFSAPPSGHDFENGDLVVLPAGAWLYASPDEQSYAIRMNVDASTTFEVRQNLGQWLEVAVSADTLPCTVSFARLEEFEIVGFVRPPSLAALVATQQVIPFDDGTELRVPVGVPLKRQVAGGTVLMPFAGHELGIPADELHLVRSVPATSVPQLWTPESQFAVTTGAEITLDDELIEVPYDLPVFLGEPMRRARWSDALVHTGCLSAVVLVRGRDVQRQHESRGLREVRRQYASIAEAHGHSYNSLAVPAGAPLTWPTGQAAGTAARLTKLVDPQPTLDGRVCGEPDQRGSILEAKSGGQQTRVALCIDDPQQQQTR